MKPDSAPENENTKPRNFRIEENTTKQLILEMSAPEAEVVKLILLTH